jgi:ATP-dependent DNA helicase HFM1/MER3
MRDATVKPQIAPSMFPAPKPSQSDTPPHQSNMSKRRADTTKPVRKPSTTSDEFGDDDIDDDTLAKAALGDLEFDHIENYANPIDTITRKNTSMNKSTEAKSTAKNKSISKSTDATADDDGQDPARLANGKWACNHPCKDRNACKHLCCKEGMEKPPKRKSAPKRLQSDEERSQPQQKALTQKGKETHTRLQLTASKRKSSGPIEELDLTQQEKKRKADYGTNGPRDYRDLHQLHKTVQGKELPSSLHSVMHRKPKYCYSQGGDHSLSFMEPPADTRPCSSSDYGEVPFDELMSHHNPLQQTHTQRDLIQPSDISGSADYTDHPATAPVVSCASDTFGDDDSLLGDAMLGLADSQTLQGVSKGGYDVMEPLEQALDHQDQIGYGADPYQMELDFTEYDNETYDAYEEPRNPIKETHSHEEPAKKLRPLFFDSNSSLQPEHNGVKAAKTMLKSPELRELKLPRAASSIEHPSASKQPIIVEDNVSDILDMFDDEPLDDVPAKEKPVPEAFKDLEPWLFQEFGDIVELVDE